MAVISLDTMIKTHGEKGDQALKGYNIPELKNLLRYYYESGEYEKAISATTELIGRCGAIGRYEFGSNMRDLRRHLKTCTDSQSNMKTAREQALIILDRIYTEPLFK